MVWSGDSFLTGCRCAGECQVPVRHGLVPQRPAAQVQLRQAGGERGAREGAAGHARPGGRPAQHPESHAWAEGGDCSHWVTVLSVD